MDTVNTEVYQMSDFACESWDYAFLEKQQCSFFFAGTKTAFVVLSLCQIVLDFIL